MSRRPTYSLPPYNLGDLIAPAGTRVCEVGEESIQSVGSAGIEKGDAADGTGLLGARGQLQELAVL